jgi:hypothetical protein
MRAPFHLLKAARLRIFGRYHPTPIPYGELVRGRTWACVDLGAFGRPLPRLVGLEGVVIMEDRDPQFFLSFRNYDPHAETRLNRHGPLRVRSTQQDLRRVVRDLHKQGLQVAIGFWSYGGGWLHRKTPWLREHPELKVLPLSSHLDPFVRLQREGMQYGEYIARQYERIRAGFGFDGLMLGDGLCGFGSVWDPDRYANNEHAIPRWTALYGVIADAVHRTRGVLLAYDHMGFSYREARMHGVDYRRLGDAGLDVLIYQSYPQAWGRYLLMEYRSRFDLQANVRNLATVKDALAGTNVKVFYTLELGDSVERWRAEPERTRAQMGMLDGLADGRFLVWGNDIIAQRP